MPYQQVPPTMLLVPIVPYQCTNTGTRVPVLIHVYSYSKIHVLLQYYNIIKQKAPVVEQAKKGCKKCKKCKSQTRNLGLTFLTFLILTFFRGGNCAWNNPYYNIEYRYVHVYYSSARYCNTRAARACYCKYGSTGSTR